jgi:hypothetical protein
MVIEEKSHFQTPPLSLYMSSGIQELLVLDLEQGKTSIVEEAVGGWVFWGLHL